MGRIVDSSGTIFEPEPVALGLELWRDEFERVWKHNTEFDNMRKVAELRKSCGAEPQTFTVSVRRPPRYAKT